MKINLLKINKKSSTDFEKKMKKMELFYKLKKLKQKAKEKNYFLEIHAKKVRSKMGNAKKGHNKTGRAKVSAP